MDLKISKKTQESLGKIIKRPPLTDKLLAKPPFRFLHDIITSVINTTGFMKGLYSADEENSDHVKDKESKIAFLQKSLDLVSLVTGRQLSMKPSKVVAGHEPEKTNEFLQVLAEAINKQVDNDSYVQRVLSSRETNKSHEGLGKEKEKSRDKSSSRKSEKERSRDKAEHKDNSRSQPPDRPKEKDDNSKAEEKERHQKGEEKERRRSSRNEEKVREKDRNNRSRNEEKEDPEREKGRGDEKSKDKRSSEREKSSRKSRKDDTKENEKPTVVEKKESDEKIEEPAPRRLQRPTSAKGSRQKREENGSSPAPLPPAPPPPPPPQPTTHEASPKQPRAEETPSQPPKQAPLARPSSARPAPPKQRKSEVIATDPIIKLGSGHPTNVITDNGQESDEDEQFIVEDNTSLQVKSSPSKEPDVEDETEHGGLVKKILETKKELEGTLQIERTLKADTSSMNSVAYQKQRHLVVQKIEKLQGSIQTLTKSANPLGKIMDYIQEDLDSMQKELSKWKQEHLQHSRALKHEKEITERTVEPLKLQLTSLEQTISDQMDVIATVKANIIRNDKRIVSMLHSVAKV